MDDVAAPSADAAEAASTRFVHGDQWYGDVDRKPTQMP